MPRPLPFALLLLAAPALAAPVPKPVLSAEQEAEFDDLWDAVPDTFASRVQLYCRLIQQPDAAVAYLQMRLPPAELGEKEAKRLIELLGSGEAKVWKPAFRELLARNPRLALPLNEVWEEATTETQRTRLGAVLMGHCRSPEHLEPDFRYHLHPQKEKDHHRQLVMIKGGSAYFGVSLNVDYEKELKSHPPAHWQARSQIAVAALVRINSPAARRHLTALAGGHPACPPTLLATATTDQPDPDKPDAVAPADVWGLDVEQFTHPASVNQLLARPKETVAVVGKKLKPLVLSKKEAAKLLADLFGDAAPACRAALGELNYFDLRLAMSFEDAWKLAKSPTDRGRLLMIGQGFRLADLDISRLDEEHKFFDYTLHPPDEQFAYWHVVSQWREGVAAADLPKNLTAGHRIGVVNALGKSVDSRWAREESAVYILDAIGTDEAIGIVKEVATGHPDAGSTKAARAVLQRRGVK